MRKYGINITKYGSGTIFATGISIGILYWLLFAFSSGMIEYYGTSLAGILGDSVGNGPFLVLYFSNASDFLKYSGLYWFPTDHIALSLPILQFVLSVSLSIMVSLIMIDLIKSKKSGGRRKGKILSIGGSVIPAVFTTGACCSLPFIYYALLVVTSVSTSFGVTLLFASYSYLLDAIIFTVLLLFHMRNKKLAGCLINSYRYNERLNIFKQVGDENEAK